MSTISAIVRILDVGLISVLQEFVNFYRNLLSPFHELLNGLPLQFSFSLLAIDLVALYLVLLMLSYRTQRGITRIVSVDYLWDFLDLFSFLKKPVRILPLSIRRWMNIVLAVSYITILCPVWRLSPLHWIKACDDADNGNIELGGRAGEYDTYKVQFVGIVYQMIALPTIVLLFFVLNAYGPKLF